MWDYRAKRSDKPLHRDDGDTVLLIVDLGMGVHTEAAIRLTGCFAPEAREFGGPESAKYLNLLLTEIEERATARAFRWPFIVVTEPVGKGQQDERRSFVRYTGALYAFDAVAGDSLNADMAAFLASHPEWGRGAGGTDEVRP